MYKKIVFPLVLLGILNFVPTASAQAAVLYFVPELETIPEGEVVSVAVMIDTQGETVRDIKLYYAYPEDLFEPIVIDLSGSVLQLFSEATGVGFAADGRVEIAGGISPPGFSGTAKVAAVRFRAKEAAGTAQLTLDPNSETLNEAGVNVLDAPSLKAATYTFEEALPPEELVLESNTESDREKGFPLLIVFVVVANVILMVAAVMYVLFKRRKNKVA